MFEKVAEKTVHNSRNNKYPIDSRKSAIKISDFKMSGYFGKEFQN